MSSKSPKNPKVKSSETTRTLPESAMARSELARQYVRAIVSLLIRVVAVGLLVALLYVQFPALRGARGIVDALSGVLVLWPFFVAVGRIFAQRIVLGRGYIQAGQAEDADAILAPLVGWKARFFDLSGEGTYWRAEALRELKRTEEARTLYTLVTETGTPEWATKAQTALTSLESKPNHESFQ